MLIQNNSDFIFERSNNSPINNRRLIKKCLPLSMRNAENCQDSENSMKKINKPSKNENKCVVFDEINNTKEEYIEYRKSSMSNVSSSSGPPKGSKSNNNENSFKLNTKLMQENRILINYKKLIHFENCFMRSRTFLKKNFDLIHAQLKSYTENSLASEKKYSKRPVKAVSCKNDEKSIDSNITENQNSSDNPSNLKDSNNIDDPTSSNEKNPETNIKEKLSTGPNKNDIKSIYTSSLVIPDFLSIKSKEYQKIVLESSYKTEDFQKKSSIKTFRNVLSAKNNNLFNSLEFITLNLIEPLQILDKHEQQIIDIEQKLNDEKNLTSDKNVKKLKKLEYSRSMIEFTIYLHRILIKIDKVKAKILLNSLYLLKIYFFLMI